MKKGILFIVCLFLLLFCAAALADVPLDEAHFPDDTFRQLLVDSGYDKNSDKVLSSAEIAKIKTLDVSDSGIRDLTGVEYLTSLTSLNCGYNDLTELNVSKNTALVSLSCYENRLTSLNVSKNKSLKVLDCGYNRLKKLNVSNNKALEELYVSGNQLTALDVTGNTALVCLECQENAITSLNVTKNTALKWLYCSDNKLAALNVTQNKALQELYCSWNKLKELNLFNNTALKELTCSNNLLTGLDLTRNTKLVFLWCQANKITQLDISSCTKLVSTVKNNSKKKNSDGFVYYGKDSEGDPLFQLDPSVKLYTKPTQDTKIRAFVTRCYQVILKREPDAGGMKTWFDELKSGRKAAAEIIDRFVNSSEFLNKKYSNAQSVEILYKAMLDRKSDAAGKKNWVSKLDAGKPFAVVINGFCVSKEFKEICDSYGIRPGTVTIPDDDLTPNGKIKAFVRRCYQIILGREADEGGLNTWFNELRSGRKAASEIIDRFVNSTEFTAKHYSYGDAVEILYKAMLGRSSDAAGKAGWVAKLQAGKPFAVVINGFCNSAEFWGICESYGIRPGSVTVTAAGELPQVIGESASAQAGKEEKKESSGAKQIVLPSEENNGQLGAAVMVVYYNEARVTEFVQRCYRSILGREPGKAELDNWTAQLMNGQKTPDQIARGFLFSQEFKNRNIGNEELVKILYRVYMNREADPEGLATWTAKLNEGMALKDLLDTFSKTNEFKKVVNALKD